jgi:hypothetical protein
VTVRPFISIVGEVLSSAGVVVALAKSDAIVLERIARGAGQTKWYYLRRASGLQTIEILLSPRSIVSFYFARQFLVVTYSDNLRKEIDGIIFRTRDCVVAFLDGEGSTLVTDTVASIHDLEEFVSNIPPDTMLYYGEFPGRDNDGVRAITITIPDRDGVTRAHPH